MAAGRPGARGSCVVVALLALAPAADAPAKAVEPLRGTVAVTGIDGDAGPGAKRQVYLLDLGTRKLRQLTRGPHSHAAFGWSPDGSRLLVSEAKAGTFGTGRTLYAIAADGSSKVLLTRRAAGGFDASWSPDGTRVAYLGSGGATLYVVGADGRQRRLLARGVVHGGFYSGNVSWSPDGTRLVFAGYHRLKVVRADGSGEATPLEYALPAGRPRAMQPTWSPDGSRIAFTATTSFHGPGAIAVMRADGRDARLLHDGHGPVWSPDGSRIAFRHNGAFTMRADGTGVSRWYAAWAGTTFSPDSAHIAYVAGAGHVPSGNIYVRTADGRRPTRVYSDHGRVFILPLWKRGSATTEAG